MLHPKYVGDRSVLAVMMVLHELGFKMSIPFGENVRYDLVLDDGSQLLRVQCKAARLRDGAVLFPTASCYSHHPHPQQRRRPYHGEIDAFCVYCAEIGVVYLVPIHDVDTTTQAALRVHPPRNNQRRGIRFASDYEIGHVATDLGEPAHRVGAVSSRPKTAPSHNCASET